LKKTIDENKPKSITHEGKKVDISKDKIQEIKELEKEHTGRISPLAALVPIIFGGLTAAWTTDEGVTTAEQKKIIWEN